MCQLILTISSNKASSPQTDSPLAVKEAKQPDIVKKIGNTTYWAKIHFSTTSKEADKKWK